MNRETKIVIVLVIILAVVCGIIFFNKQGDKNQLANSNRILNETAQNVTDEIINKVENVNTFEENNSNKKEDNINADENKSSNTSENEKTFETDSDRAIEMAKNEWGKDDNVTFKIDEQTEDGKYVVCVMEKSTTKVIIWYNVDVKNNTIEEI